MKNTIILLSIIGALALTNSVQAYNSHVMYFETTSGKILEIPAYIEPAVNDPIPGQESIELDMMEAQSQAQQALDRSNLSRVLLCITKQEETEPFPYELN